MPQRNLHIDEPRLKAIIEFLHAADALKTTYRAAYVGDGSRHESDAEHAWHASLMAALLHAELNVEANLAHTLELLLVHDLVEVYAGDAPLHDEVARAGKRQREVASAEKLFALLPEEHARRLRSWWDEFEGAGTPEARFANELDRLQAILQNVFARGKTWDDWKVTEEVARERNSRALGFEPSLRKVFEVVFRQAREGKLFHQEL